MNKTLLLLAGTLMLYPQCLVSANEPQWARRVGVQVAVFEHLLQRQISQDWLQWQQRPSKERYRRFEVTKCFVSAPYNGKQVPISPIVFQRLRSRRVGKCLVIGQERWLQSVKNEYGEYIFVESPSSPANVSVQLSHLRFTSPTEARAHAEMYWGAEPNSEGEGSAEWFLMKLKRGKNGWKVISSKITAAAG